MFQDGPEPYETTVRQIGGDEYDQWWKPSVDVYSPSTEHREAEYQEKAPHRKIPIFLTEALAE